MSFVPVIMNSGMLIEAKLRSEKDMRPAPCPEIAIPALKLLERRIVRRRAVSLELRAGYDKCRVGTIGMTGHTEAAFINSRNDTLVERAFSAQAAHHEGDVGQAAVEIEGVVEHTHEGTPCLHVDAGGAASDHAPDGRGLVRIDRDVWKGDRVGVRRMQHDVAMLSPAPRSVIERAEIGAEAVAENDRGIAPRLGRRIDPRQYLSPTRGIDQRLIGDL